MLNAIQIELISYYYNDILTDYLDIKKPYKLLTLKYYWSIFCYNI